MQTHNPNNSDFLPNQTTNGAYRPTQIPDEHSSEASYQKLPHKFSPRPGGRSAILSITTPTHILP